MRAGGSRVVAAAIVAIAAAFWIWFGVASAAGERLGLGNWIGHLLLPGGVLLVSLLIALRWERLGGSLLVLEGLAVLVAYPLLMGRRFDRATVVFVLSALALPPLASGLVFLVHAMRTQRRTAI